MIEIRIERYRFRIDPLHGLRVAVGKRGDRSSWAVAIGCLLSLYPLHLGAVEVATPPATPAPKESATDQTTSWEEPSLFPQEGTGGVAPTPVFPNERSHRESDVNKIEPPPIETDNATMARATAAFQAEFSNANSNYSNLAGIGLESTKERDAILARIQRDATNQPYNIKLGRIPLQMGASLIVDFSDNIGASSANKEADLTVIPRLEISGAVKLGSRTTLSLGLCI